MSDAEVLMVCFGFFCLVVVGLLHRIWTALERIHDALPKRHE